MRQKGGVKIERASEGKGEGGGEALKHLSSTTFVKRHSLPPKTPLTPDTHRQITIEEGKRAPSRLRLDLEMRYLPLSSRRGVRAWVQDARSRVVCGCERIENIQLSPLRDRKAFLTKE